jgi:hypothetical protein
MEEDGVEVIIFCFFEKIWPLFFLTQKIPEEIMLRSYIPILDFNAF